MFSIGDFARLGLVSVRMLRHYDAIGLLPPAHVDPYTGYRSYQAAQLARLNRIVALKDLGFTLDQVARILDEKLSAEELHGMVRLRRAQLEAQIDADLARLRGVESRLRMIEKEGVMRTAEIVVKQVPAVRVAELSAVAASYEPADIGPVIQPLYDRIMERMEAAGSPFAGPSIAYYLPLGDGTVEVHAAFPVTVASVPGLTMVDLPALAEAATLVHHGSLDTADASIQAMAHWIEDNGYRSLGLSREVYLHCPPDTGQAGWVTELQMEIAKV